LSFSIVTRASSARKRLFPIYLAVTCGLPLAPFDVTVRLNANKRRHPQLDIRPLRLAIPVHQLAFAYLAGFRIENGNLLPPRMEITSCNSS